jgi:hypothetical protein
MFYDRIEKTVQVVIACVIELSERVKALVEIGW